MNRGGFLPASAISRWKASSVSRSCSSRRRRTSFNHSPIDGAVHRVAGDATAWNARDATWSMVIAGIDADPRNAEALKHWGRAYWKRVHPFNLDGAYVNFMMDDEAADRIPAAYGDNFARLALIKAKYDPTNLFRVNQNILPSTPAAE